MAPKDVLLKVSEARWEYDWCMALKDVLVKVGEDFVPGWPSKAVDFWGDVSLRDHPAREVSFSREYRTGLVFKICFASYKSSFDESPVQS